MRKDKTAHQNKPMRVSPLFPEFATPLRDLHEHAEVGEPFAFPMMNRGTLNSRKPFLKMLKAASVEPWPNLWNSVRSTCGTELAAI